MELHRHYRLGALDLDSRSFCDHPVLALLFSFVLLSLCVALLPVALYPLGLGKIAGLHSLHVPQRVLPEQAGPCTQFLKQSGLGCHFGPAACRPSPQSCYQSPAGAEFREVPVPLTCPGSV
jgi:hypothetical protein